MKMYVTSQGVTLIGNGQEIKATIKRYMEQYQTVKEWKENTLSAKTNLLKHTAQHLQHLQKS